MRVGVGYSDNPDSIVAGIQAARKALEQADKAAPCDLVLLFATARHEPNQLKAAVTSILGREASVVGGGAIGIISNDYYAYSGDQVGLAAIWLEDAAFDLLTEVGLSGTVNETEIGRKLGDRLAALGYVDAQTPILLFYDATGRDLRLARSTPLLAGLSERLPFTPRLVGAGLQGDYICSPTSQWAGREVVQNAAMVLTLRGNIHFDCAVMHGCRPGTGYYTVTKSDQQTILEIDGQPALPFINSIMRSLLAPEDYPLLLIFGINSGPKWAPFNEANYASRLCLDIDRERNGIIMFEPDMVAGTEFQIMYRSFDLNYMEPEIKQLFNRLEGRKPVLAMYINCAVRAAGYTGTDLEDALIIQQAVNERAPLLGIYSGVEIAPVNNRPRALDWTGVFCLFSMRE